MSWDASELSNVNYSVTVVPALTSTQSVLNFVTSSTSLQLLFEYGTNYVVEVTAFNCVGNSTHAALNITSGTEVLR